MEQPGAIWRQMPPKRLNGRWPSRTMPGRSSSIQWLFRSNDQRADQSKFCAVIVVGILSRGGVVGYRDANSRIVSGRTGQSGVSARRAIPFPKSTPLAPCSRLMPHDLDDACRALKPALWKNFPLRFAHSPRSKILRRAGAPLRCAPGRRSPEKWTPLFG